MDPPTATEPLARAGPMLARPQAQAGAVSGRGHGSDEPWLEEPIDAEHRRLRRSNICIYLERPRDAQLDPFHVAMAADLTGRQMFMQDPGHPATEALANKFGTYAPRRDVRLAWRETGSKLITSSLAACLTDERRAPLPAPVRSSTAGQARVAVAVVEGEVSDRARPMRGR